MTMLDLWPVEKPAHAAECWYCRQDDLGEWTSLEDHEHWHLPLTCRVCGGAAPNRLLFEQSHGLNRGQSWDHGYVVCSSLGLRLNHITYALRHGGPIHSMDATVFELGFLFGPDCSPVPPAGWPTNTDLFEGGTEAAA